MFCQHDTNDLISRLERNGAHRVLRKLQIYEGHTGIEYRGGMTFIGVVVDVETTGLDPAQDVIIELALRRFRYDSSGRILSIDRGYTWFEDPGRPLCAEITRLTGLTNEGLRGQEIDEGEAVRLLSSAGRIIAHNAAFDCKFVEARLPRAAGLEWACSCKEVDWSSAGFDGRSLGWLSAQAGWFYDAHRASNDVDAVIALLAHTLPNDCTVLAALIERSDAPTIRVEAAGADFSVKEALRARGYSWNADTRAWWRDIGEADLAAEESWLSQYVYGSGCKARTIGPRLTKITARERYR